MLLYPSPHAVDVHDMPSESFPEHLLVIDGTWSHSYALYKGAPWMANLPHLKIENPTPSSYRIRKEPARHCVATLEAIVQTLRVLEPKTDLSPLLRAFDEMIDQQAAHEKDRNAPRTRRARVKGPVLTTKTRHLLEHALLVYYETHADSGQRGPVYLTAYRPRTGESFQCRVRDDNKSMTQIHYENMGLSEDFFVKGVSLSSLREEFGRFFEADDVLTTWNKIPADSFLCNQAGIQLKAIYCNLIKGPSGHLRDVLARIGVKAQSNSFAGRAGGRMGAAMAIHRYLLQTPEHLAPSRI